MRTDKKTFKWKMTLCEIITYINAADKIDPSILKRAFGPKRSIEMDPRMNLKSKPVINKRVRTVAIAAP